jgi:hypothetical protein
MSIIAYASANVDPINNPLEDGEIDLASVATPASITLYGDAVDTEDGSASFSFAWTLLDPTDSGAVLSSTATQNITITNITAWHNLRLHLVATNTATSATSETDVLLAPSASFVEVRVLSENRGIQKIAKGSRSWHPALEVWADAIETAPNLNDLSDVTNATGAELDVLRGGALAESGGSALHTHAGAHIADATTTTAGVVQLEEASDATGTPRVITQERIVLSGMVTSSTESDGTRHDEIIDISAITEDIPHIYFTVSRHALKIHAYTVAIAETGGTTDAYSFKLIEYTPADFLTMSGTLTHDTFSATPSAANAPILETRTLSPAVEIPAGRVIGLHIGASPAAGSGGGSLSVTIEATRSVT